MRSSRSCGGRCRLASRQRCSSACARSERRAIRRDRGERRPPVALRARLGAQRDQVVVARAEQRAAQRLREREAVARRDDRIQHRDEVERLGRLVQHQLVGGDVRHVARLQRLGGEPQRLALAAQHDHVLRQAVAGVDERADRAGHFRGLAFAQHLLGLVARHRQRVAPDRLFVGSARAARGGRSMRSIAATPAAPLASAPASAPVVWARKPSNSPRSCGDGEDAR